MAPQQVFCGFWFLVVDPLGPVGLGCVRGLGGSGKMLSWKFTDQLGAMDLVLCTDAMELSIQK